MGYLMHVEYLNDKKQSILFKIHKSENHNKNLTMINKKEKNSSHKTKQPTPKGSGLSKSDVITPHNGKAMKRFLSIFDNNMFFLTERINYEL